MRSMAKAKGLALAADLVLDAFLNDGVASMPGGSGGGWAGGRSDMLRVCLGRRRRGDRGFKDER